MKHKIVIPGRLPGLNDIIAAAKAGKGRYQPYAIMKAKHTESIAWIAKQLPCFGRVDIKIFWYEPNKRRDPDNISGGGKKFILDGLVMAGVIKDDTINYINSIASIYDLDRNNPRIEVEIMEATDE